MCNRGFLVPSSRAAKTARDLAGGDWSHNRRADTPSELAGSLIVFAIRDDNAFYSGAR